VLKAIDSTFVLGVCRCRKGCFFMTDPIGCFESGMQGPCLENQSVQDSGDGEIGICNCKLDTFLIEGFEGCYSYFDNPCGDGSDLQLKDGVGICNVSWLDL